MPDEVLLKKYANRRLYDTEKSTYITLSQVSEIVREGRQVKVVDAKTDEDVTAFILTQIIVEEARRKDLLLPVSLLHLIIQYGRNALGEFFEKYLELTIRNYLAQKAALDQQFRNWLDMGRAFSIREPTSAAPFAGIDSLYKLFPGLGKSTSQDSPPED
jgi:polyhydroxyalkanoate synthesis repressor PhaR